MARLPSPNKIKTHRIYTIWEAAEALEKHRQTIVRWINDRGLIADKTCKPWLIEGKNLKAFLGQRRQKVRVTHYPALGVECCARTWSLLPAHCRP